MAIAAALFTGYSAYNSQNSNELTDIALANVEALAESNESGNTSGNERPRYINKTEIKTRTETSTEITDSSITIEYKRTCSDVITYCKYTGKNEDICYVDLNGILTSCEDWKEK